MKKIILSSIVLITILSSCLVGPKYTRPDMKAPDAWVEQSAYVNTNDTIFNLKWFDIFNDTVLNSLIDEALAKNYDLDNALIRIEQSRDLYGMSKADFWPSFGYSANANVNGSSPNNYNLNINASWEIDFWGKVRHANRAAYAEILASEEGVKAITTILISDVASLYFLLRDLDNRLMIADQTVVSRTEYFNIINERFLGGDVSELDMLQADQQLSIAKATVSSTRRQLNSTERSLNILLGQMPQPIPRGLENVEQGEFPLIPAGLPSYLLEQRPDVKQAELMMQAETERIGIAQAMRFPSLSLTGLFGVASGDLTTLFTDASIITNASATILGPIFNFGKNKRRVEMQRKEAEIAANNYISTYISALGEVENSLVSIQMYKEEYEARKKQAAAASKALMLSQERYSNGYSDYIEVLIAETAMLDSELGASATKAQQLSAYLTLYKSLGGGW